MLCGRSIAHHGNLHWTMELTDVDFKSSLFSMPPAVVFRWVFTCRIVNHVVFLLGGFFFVLSVRGTFPSGWEWDHDKRGKATDYASAGAGTWVYANRKQDGDIQEHSEHFLPAERPGRREERKSPEVK